MISLARQWAVISALLLISIIALIYMGIVRYAQSIRIPYDGISVSEEVDLIVASLSLWNACSFGLLILGATFLCWRAVLHQAPEHDATQQKRIKASLIIIPLICCALYMLVNYSVGVVVSTSFNAAPGIATPTPIRQP